MKIPATNRQSTIVRPIEPADIGPLMRMIDTAWRVHLRVAPSELHAKIKVNPGFVALDSVGLRGFMIIEPTPPNSALIIAAGLRDSWNISPFLDVLLPKAEQAALNNQLQALVYIGNSVWLVDELPRYGFKTREWIVTFERFNTTLPPEPNLTPAKIRTAHRRDLPDLLNLDDLVFDHIWHKSTGNFNQALASAGSFSVAIIDDKIVAYQWCDVYQKLAHLTRLAVHPEYQGLGIGAQMLHRAIVDVLEMGANVITLNTQETNKRSQALYTRFGFVNTKQRMPVLWKDLG